MTLDSDNVRFMWIFAGFPGKGASNDSGAIENIDFQGFRVLHLRHLKKWGQHCYMVLSSPLLPFNLPPNTWPWMTLNGHFTLNFHCCELLDHITVSLCAGLCNMQHCDRHIGADLFAWPGSHHGATGEDHILPARFLLVSLSCFALLLPINLYCIKHFITCIAL